MGERIPRFNKLNRSACPFDKKRVGACFLTWFVVIYRGAIFHIGKSIQEWKTSAWRTNQINYSV